MLQITNRHQANHWKSITKFKSDYMGFALNQTCSDPGGFIYQQKIMRFKIILKTLLLALIAGMGNVKQNNKPGIIIYFSAIILLGFGLYSAEQRIIEQYFQPSQTLRTFAVLIYIAFAFFWDGTWIIGSNERNYFNDKNGDGL
jgi:hypothetical protein